MVIGGGSAGLSAALMLGRACRSVLLIDGAEPRNARAEHIYGFPSRDGTSRSTFLESTRAELVRYDVTVVNGTVVTTAGTSAGFLTNLASGEQTYARRVLAASGITDTLPDVPGLDQHWGRSVVHCPYCHGWELRGRRVGVLATVPGSIHQALLFSQWTDQLTLLLHTQNQPTVEQAEQLAARGIRTVRGEVVEIVTMNDRVSGARLVTGEQLSFDAIAVAPLAKPRAGLLAPLGLTPQPHPSGMGDHIPADETGRTAVEGVWVAGNLTNPNLNVLGAANAGAIAAGTINLDLIAEDTSTAIRATRNEV